MVCTYWMQQNIDLTSAAELYLYKTLVKTKSIAAAQVLPHYVISKAEAINPFQKPAYANVTARLFKSSPVRTTINEVLGLVREALGISNISDASRTKKRLRKSDYDVKLELGRTPKIDVEDGNAKEDPIHQEPFDTTDHIAKDDSDDDDYKQYKSRLADDSDSNGYSSDERHPSIHKSETSDSLSRDGRTEQFHQQSNQDLVSSSSSPEPPPSSRKRIVSTTPTVTQSTSTTFLPSLMMGGYISGSESATDISEEERKNAQVRKNRMGQQARRALWEKKYGTKANHIKKQRQSRDHGWDAQRGAMPSHDPDKFGRMRRNNLGESGYRDRPRASGANNDPVKHKDVPQKSQNASLHPSWEAAKKMKEQKKKTAFEGKKIVFD